MNDTRSPSTRAWMSANNLVLYALLARVIPLCTLLAGCDLSFFPTEALNTNLHSYDLVVPESEQIYSFEFRVTTQSDWITAILVGELNNEISSGDERETSIDPETGYLVELERIDENEFVLRIIAKPVLYPEGTFAGSSEYSISIRDVSEPASYEVTFFDADGAQVV